MMIAKPPSDPVPSLTAALQHKQQHIRQRAMIIMMTLDGADEDAIAEQVGVSKRTIAKWQNAWDQDGLWIFPSDVYTIDADAQPDDTTDAKAQPAMSDPVAARADEMPPADVSDVPLRIDIKLPDDVHPLDSMGAAARKLLVQNLSRMVAWEPVAAEGVDPEGVHKMRVATRRMRSLMDVFTRYIDGEALKTVRKRVRTTARRLGEVRDLDVYLETLHRYVESELDGDMSSLQPMLKVLDKRYEHARNRMLRWLSGKHFDSFVRDFHKLLKGDKLPVEGGMTSYSVQQMAPRLIYTYLEFMRLHQPLLADADINMLHELRLDAKRFRYVMEFFDGVLGPESKTVIEHCKQLQDYLGELNDLSTAIDITRELQDDLSGDDKAGAKAFRRYCRDRAESMRTAALEAWETFDTPDTRMALGQAVGAL